MRIHQIKIDFNVTPQISRYVYVYIIESTNLYMIDSGVAGCETQIEAFLHYIGRSIDELNGIFLTHAHPDHIGTAAYFKEKTGCKIYASEGERAWIEDIDMQYQERPIPNFYALAGKSVNVDVVVHDRDVLQLEDDIKIEVVSTPGHSADEVSYVIGSNIFIGDAVPVKEDIPIYVSMEDSIKSINKIMTLPGITNFYPAWDCKYSNKEISLKCSQALEIISQLDNAVKSIKDYKNTEELTRKVCERIGNLSLMNNPLFMRTIKSHLKCELRTFVYEDASTILSWCKTKREFRLWTADRYKDYPGIPDEMIRLYEGEGKFPLTMVEGGRIVGHIMLRYPSEDKDVIRFGFVIVDNTLRGKGYGRKLLQLAVDYARDILRAKKVTLGVFCDNHSAFECYRSAGFTVIGNDSYMIDGEEWQGYEMEFVVN